MTGDLEERRGPADLPSEALAVLREQGARGFFVSSGLVFLGVLASGAIALALYDAFEVKALDPLKAALAVLDVAILLGVATSGPFIMSWHRRAGALGGLAKLCALQLPDAAIVVFLLWFGHGPRLLGSDDMLVIGAAAAFAWLVGSAVLFPLAPAAVFFERPAGLRAALRRASALARGDQVLGVLVRVVPVLVFGGGFYQLNVAEGPLGGGLGPGLRIAAQVFGIAMMAASPILAGVLGVAGYRIAVTNEPEHDTK